MKTITIDILNERAINLLRELKALNLIKILKKDALSPSKKLSQKKTRPSDYKGIIPSEVAEKLQDYVSKSRKEF